MLAKQAQTMAAYNRWMNEKLYAACAELSDEERKLDRHAFFKSIHGTLNHILLADRVWFGRFIGKPFPMRSLDQELYADFADLRAERGSTDQDIEGWTQGLTDEQLADIHPWEEWVLAASHVGTPAEGEIEGDLFAGVRSEVSA